MTRSRRMPPSAFLRLLRRHTSGPFRLEGVTVTGDLDLSGQSFGFDLELPGCRIEGALILDGVTGQSIDLTGLHAEAVQAFRLRLSTDLTLRQAVIGSGNGTEPLADQRVTGSGDEVAGPFGVPRHKAVSSAVLELSDARIDGDLMLADLTLGSSGQWSLYADQLQVTGSVTGTGLSATGAVHLRAANIGGAVYLNGARIAGMEASVAQIRRGLYVDWGFTSTGQVRLRSSEVGVLVTFHDAVITGGLNLARLRTPRLRLDFRDRPEGRIVLRDAQVDAYVDNRESWPEPGRLDLEGLTYRRLAEGPGTDHQERLRWLRLDQHAGAGSYEQLALCYARAGDERAARLVRLARQRRIRRGDRLPARVWSVLQDVLFGYGYLPGRALAWLLFLVTTGALWFAAHPPRRVKNDGPAWDPVLYVLDLIVPVANLGHRTAWDPAGIDKAVSVVLILSGWLLATAVIAGVGRVLNRG
ncbi:hypothetical protein HD597_011810 [Nonomuraea thailandensis]|uniref:Oxidoreductase n=1 Tax=Nonomuraea thailandensis TaxID=1188745 RepID=A0A9X2GVP9_9ACTN|nr:hypothetical protein [Nonomuraea thailandensis]MCP2364790.1 hypothetical protein [Nonomuraea thailandensis]